MRKKLLLWAIFNSLVIFNCGQPKKFDGSLVKLPDQYQQRMNVVNEPELYQSQGAVYQMPAALDYPTYQIPPPPQDIREMYYYQAAPTQDLVPAAPPATQLGSGFCGSPVMPTSRCPVPWYRPEANNFYWDSSAGNCLPYFGPGCSTSQQGSNIYNTYDDCMSVCAFQQRQEELFYCPSNDQAIPMSWKCNGYMDCMYGEDELQCGTGCRSKTVWELTDANFDQTLMWSGENVLVDFFAPWCKACVKFNPQLELASQEACLYGMDVVFAKVNLDKNPILKSRFSIRTFPRLLLFPRSGSRPRRFFKKYGLEKANFIAWLRAKLGEDLTYSSPCSLNYFPCADNSGCVPVKNVCDKVFNCLDGSDEQFCNKLQDQPEEDEPEDNTVVKPELPKPNPEPSKPEPSKPEPSKPEPSKPDTQKPLGNDTIIADGGSKPANCDFKCNDGSCQPSQNRCDGKKDCPDGIDERNCGETACMEFKCVTSGDCIDLSKKCDGSQDCDDNSDEENCQENCDPKLSWQCQDGKSCIDIRRKCDSHPDCADASDENLENCPMNDCNSELNFKCSNGEGCIDNRRRCDGHSDCRDNSDEQNCKDVECHYWQIKCISNGICVDKRRKCDNTRDCEDGSDEMNCEESKPANQTNNSPNYDLPNELDPNEGNELECPKVCTKEYEPVCGSDGATYQNKCQLKLVQCEEKKPDLYIDFDGECPESQQPEKPQENCNKTCLGGYTDKVCGNDGVTYGNKCQLENQACLFPEKNLIVQFPGDCADCPVVCTADFRPVCGSNGKTYPNLCQFKAAKCSPNSGLSDLQLAYEGKCINEECKEKCTKDYKPVCGTDGQTYSNLCSLNAVRCQGNNDLEVANEGACELTSMNDRDCPLVCTADFRPVCGSNGKTYSNLCQLKAAKCSGLDDLEVASEGECQSDDCNQACTREYKPVCGTDGQTYPNLCSLNAVRCQGNNDLEMKFEGECEQSSLDGKDCPIVCTADFRPICGSNGKTYSNLCQLKAAKCSGLDDLEVASEGECQSDDCKDECTKEYKPVCGTDGQTYSNECDLKAARCKGKEGLKVAQNGPCVSDNKNCSETNQFMCSSDDSCIDLDKQCNQIADCPNAEDERYCPDSFVCNDNATVLAKSQVCDNFPDCPDGDDEDCPSVCDPFDQFTCKNGECIAKGDRCNGYIDCIDNSDEFDCPKEPDEEPMEEEKPDISTPEYYDDYDYVGGLFDPDSGSVVSSKPVVTYDTDVNAGEEPPSNDYYEEENGVDDWEY